MVKVLIADKMSEKAEKIFIDKGFLSSNTCLMVNNNLQINSNWHGYN